MARLKKLIQSVKKFSKDVYSAPSGQQCRLLAAAVDRAEQYQSSGTLVDLDVAISALKESLGNPPKDIETNAVLYYSLGTHLAAKYDRIGAQDTLGEVIRAFQESVTLTQQHGTALTERLQSLGYWLCVKFVKNPTDPDDFEAVRVLQRGLNAPHLDNSTRGKLLNTLAALLVKQRKHAAKSDRPDDVISIVRTPMENTLRETPDRRTSIERDLGVEIQVKECLVAPELSDSVGGLTNQAQLSQNLGFLYGHRWSFTRAASDLHHGVEHLRNALSNSSEDLAAVCWHDLGLLLSLRGYVLKADQDLDEAIQCFQESMKREHPTNLQKLHRRIETANSIKASFRPDEILDIFENSIPGNPQDDAEFQQRANRSAAQPRPIASLPDGADKCEEVTGHRSESKKLTTHSSSRLREQSIDPLGSTQISGMSSVSPSMEFEGAAMRLSNLGDFRKRWQSRQIQLRVKWQFSPQYEELLASIRDEYSPFHGLRLDVSSKEPLSMWKDEFENWLETIDPEREAQFTDWTSANANRENGLYPLSMQLFLHDDQYRLEPQRFAAQRCKPYVAVMENWERVRTLYQDSPSFRGTFSRHQEHSFGVLIDWWESRYTHDLDINDFHQQFRSLLEHPPGFHLEVAWAKIQWGSQSVYHSTCLELFFRELHPFSWEPFARRSCLSVLGATRNHAYQVALKQRHAWASFKNSTKEKRPERNPVHMFYPQYFHESRIMGENPVLEKEELRLFGADMPIAREILQWDDRNPFYLWDTEKRITTTTGALPTPLDYLCISHTWGRWRKDEVFVHVQGVPWPVPANTLYDVESFPDILDNCLLSTERYVWIDLFCIPQGDFDPAKQEMEIDKQASIFGRSQRCIAWLHDVEGWTGVRNALRYMASTYVQRSTTDNGRGVGLPITQEQFQEIHVDADRHMELMEVGKWGPSTWFSSLWTLQEAVLCPDLQLCSKSMEILLDDRDCPIGLRTLFMIFTPLHAFDLAIPVSSAPPTKTSSTNTREPRSVLGFQDFSKLTRFDQLLMHLYPTDVLIQTSVRQSTESRAPAIMSALAITDWKKGDRKSATPLVLGSFPLDFVQAAARKIGAVFFFSYSNGPRKTRIQHSAMSHDQEVGSLLPFSEPHDLRTTIKLGGLEDTILKPIDHESVNSWGILPDGGVRIPSASIMASSVNSFLSGTLVKAAILLDPRHDLKELPSLVDFNSTWTDLNKGLSSLAGTGHDCFAVVLFEDLGWQYGILLRGQHVDGGPTTQFVKIGLFHTLVGMEAPESIDVSWIVS